MMVHRTTFGVENGKSAARTFGGHTSQLTRATSRSPGHLTVSCIVGLLGGREHQRRVAEDPSRTVAILVRRKLDDANRVRHAPDDEGGLGGVNPAKFKLTH